LQQQADPVPEPLPSGSGLGSAAQQSEGERAGELEEQEVPDYKKLLNEFNQMKVARFCQWSYISGSGHRDTKFHFTLEVPGFATTHGKGRSQVAAKGQACSKMMALLPHHLKQKRLHERPPRNQSAPGSSWEPFAAGVRISSTGGLHSMTPRTSLHENRGSPRLEMKDADIKILKKRYPPLDGFSNSFIRKEGPGFFFDLEAQYYQTVSQKLQIDKSWPCSKAAPKTSVTKAAADVKKAAKAKNSSTTARAESKTF